MVLYVHNGNISTMLLPMLVHTPQEVMSSAAVSTVSCDGNSRLVSGSGVHTLQATGLIQVASALASLKTHK